MSEDRDWKMMSRIPFAFIAALAASLIVAPCAASAKEAGPINPSMFNAMRWRDIGPYRGGRVLAVEGVSGVPGLFYFGAAAGGVWKTEDSGGHWKPIFDQVSDSSIGAIAVAPSNHKVIYVGTGEGALRNTITYGRGVYKSVDGGESWTHVGLSDTRQIGALIVDPRNPDIVLVAAIGHAYGPNAERGVFHSEDGGKSWKKVLYRDENTGAADVAYDPHDPNIVYASLWQVRMQPWHDTSRGPGSGLFRSKDGGKTWTELKGNGLPEGPLGRIGIAISRADPRLVYALIDAKDGGLYRSDDGGEHWTRVSQDARLTNRPMYYTKIYADPKSADTVYVPNTALYRSTDGGKSFDLFPVIYSASDHHGLWIDPADPRRMIDAADQGASVSLDHGQTWSTLNNQPTGQFYRVAVDNRFPYWIYSAQQDYTNIAIASYASEGAIGPRSWYPAGGGEAGFVVPDPRDPMVIYSSSSRVIGRYDKRQEQFQDISPWPHPRSNQLSGEPRHRFHWTSPLMLSPHDPDLLYTASQVIWKSADHGNSWTIISPDLTRHDKSKRAGPGSHGTISAMTESLLQKGMLWAGSDAGRVHLTRDGGRHWTDVTPKAMPEWGEVSMIQPSPFNPEVAYLTVDRHKLDDIKPYAFKTNDAGKSWTPIAAGLPTGAFLRAVREDPKRAGLLYAATERGAYVSFNGGEHWQPLQLNLPATPIHDLVVKGDDLVVATHGRGFWILDNLTPLRQITTDTGSQEVILFAPQTAFRLATQSPTSYLANFDAAPTFPRGPAGRNPPSGALIDYVLRKKPQGEVTLDILDAKGALVRHLSSTKTPQEKRAFTFPAQMGSASEIASMNKISAEVGMHRVVWDLRSNDPEQVSGVSGLGVRGVRVAPGKYRVRLSVDDKIYEEPLTLVADPRSVADEAAIAAKVALQMAVLNDIDRLHKAINELRKLRESGDKAKQRVAKEDSFSFRLAMLAKEMDAIDGMLVEVHTREAADAYAFPIELDADTAPTQQERVMVGELHRKVEAAMAAWSSLKTGQIEQSENNLINTRTP